MKETRELDGTSEGRWWRLLCIVVYKHLPVVFCLYTTSFIRLGFGCVLDDDRNRIEVVKGVLLIAGNFWNGEGEYTGWGQV